jgi:DNA-binding GntR family transcriptional regulator
MQPGERIVELRLARDLGVSQTPVREALAELAQEGLVTRVEHRGSFVSKLEKEEFKELVTLRAVLEGYCAALASPQIAATHLDLLKSKIEMMRHAAAADDLSALIEADLAFHSVLYELSRHRLLVEVLTGLQARMRLAVAFADTNYSPNLCDIADSHLPIVHALGEADPILAEQAAKDHELEALPHSDDDALGRSRGRRRGNRR